MSIHPIWRLTFVQKQGAQEVVGVAEFPPMQKGGSFNLDAVKAEILKAMEKHAGQ